MQRGRRSCALLLTAAIAAAAAIAAPALGTSYAFRNSAPIPSVPLAQAQLTFSCLPWPTGPTTGSLPFSTARSHARALVKPSSVRFHKLQRLRFLDKSAARRDRRSSEAQSLSSRNVWKSACLRR
jgi:hypothetical protein